MEQRRHALKSLRGRLPMDKVKKMKEIGNPTLSRTTLYVEIFRLRPAIPVTFKNACDDPLA